MRPQKLLYVLADGARARLVARSPQTRDFATFAELDGRGALEGLRAELRTSPPAENRQSATGQRHSLGRDRFERQQKEDFVRDVAERTLQAFRDGEYQGVVIAAPARLIGALRNGLEAEVPVIAELGKDLTKTPDSSLERWLGHEATLGAGS